MRRLVVVGGAGGLGTASGLDRVDTPDFPAVYRAESLARREVLRLLRAEVGDDLDCTYVSPAEEIAPGERTGTFRLGGDELLTAEDGGSFVSAQDYAAALVDGVEKSAPGRRRITVAY
nr:hypothetical protein [Streptomyces boncukensis]